ncbi:oxygenase MpaB family protein [Streptomyces sp. NPDC021212]|uniref:oxygenase MpaB family protein n=1 Tax=Streptomyces sp. NPDC021212 TaxID=3365118 RepID=UPI003790CB6A
MSGLREAEETYRRMAYDTVAQDLKMGLNLGFCRTFAVPEIARVALFEYGLDSEQGAETIAALDRLHAPFAIGDDAFRYVLACFDLAPMRWCAAHAWRAPTDAERTASHTLHLGLADRMGIPEVPATWREFETGMRAYERAHFAVTPEGRALRARAWRGRRARARVGRSQG